jgi:hypothetical protein
VASLGDYNTAPQGMRKRTLTKAMRLRVTT